MELRHLRAFLVVAEEGNITRAARRLHISQPPLTRQIRQLEAHLGTELFRRSPRGVELTDAGRVLKADAERILELADRSAERALRAGQGVFGRIDIALFGTGIFGAIPVLLRAYRDRFPDVKIVLHNMGKQEQLEALAQERISLAFNRLMHPVPGITSEVLLTEPLFVAMPRDHRLSARTAVRLEELEGVPMVVFPTGLRPSFIDRVHAMCQRVGFAPEVVAEVADVVHGIAMVASGGGVCLIPLSATYLQVPGVSYRRLHAERDRSIDLCCVYRTDDPSPTLAHLLASMRETAASRSWDRQER